jgi:hypothetical protein
MQGLESEYVPIQYSRGRAALAGRESCCADERLLDLLHQTCKKGRWNCEKAHSILHKVMQIILWGNSDNLNASSPGPEVYTGIYWYIAYTGIPF